MATGDRRAERPLGETADVVPSLAPWTPEQGLVQASGTSPAPVAWAALVEAAHTAAGAAGKDAQAVSHLTDALTDAARHASPQTAQELLELLERDMFHNLTAKGKSLRALAVEVVVAQGYPLAMSLRVEDVQHWREHEERNGGLPMPWFASVVLGSAIATMSVPVFDKALSGLGLERATLLACLAPLAALFAVLSPRGSGRSRGGLLGLTSLALALALVAALSTGGMAAAVPAMLAATAAGGLLWSESAERDRDPE